MNRYLFIVLLTASILACPARADGQADPSTRPASRPAWATSTRPAPPEVVERIANQSGAVVSKLSNGLTVIIKATTHAPVVCVRAYVKTGGIYEGPWLGSGISHLTEHLVAKGAVHDMGGGTDKAAKQTTGRVQEIGGQSNAYTSLSHTCYYISAAAGKADDCIDLVADWLARPEITAEDFQREHGVVQRELEMGKDDPPRQMWRAHAANFFAGHPAGVPIIGYAAPLSKLTRDDVLAYHRLMYVPQNMVFSVVGDIDPVAALERVRRAFAGFDRALVPQVVLPSVANIAGVRRVTRPHKALTEVLQRMSFRTIPLVHDDLYALDVLSYVLAQGRASRLVRTIQREKKLVTSIGSSSWTPEWGAGMFTVSFRAAADKADQAAEAIGQELKAIVAEGVQADELERAKRQKVSDLVYSQQTVESISATLATDWLSTDDVDFSRNYTRRIQAVTADEVRQAARKYFKFDAMVVTRLVPALAAGTKPGAETRLEERDKPGTSMFTLPNGLRVVLHPTDAVALVSMALVSRGGVLLEDDQTNGLGALMTGLSTKGAGERSAQQIAKFFDRAGGSVTGNCGNNSFYWQATVLQDSFGEALEILADIIVRPRFSDKELEILRPVALDRIKQKDEHWFGQLSKFYRGKFFTGSPYRLLPVGNAKVLAAATSEQVAEYHRKCVLAGSSVLAVYGNFDATAAAQSIKTGFADLPGGSTALPIPSARTVSKAGEKHVLETDNEVAAIMVAAPGMKITNLEDRFPINVLDTIISGWQLPSGWLHTELRGKQLVYVVHAYNWAGLAPGAFAVYAACQPENADQVVEIITRNLDKAASYQPTQKEIDLAVNAILTAELLDNQEMSSLALATGLDELYDLGYDFRGRTEQYYRQVTPAEVLRVAKKYLGRGYVVTVTTPKAEQKDESSK